MVAESILFLLFNPSTKPKFRVILIASVKRRNWVMEPSIFDVNDLEFISPNTLGTTLGIKAWCCEQRNFPSQHSAQDLSRLSSGLCSQCLFPLCPWLSRPSLFSSVIFHTASLSPSSFFPLKPSIKISSRTPSTHLCP